MDDILKIAGRLKELRTFSDYSTAEMAEKIGVEEKEYIAYESAEIEVPINVIYHMASLLDTEPGYILTGKMPEKDKAVVVYEGKGANIKRYEGYSFSSLAADFKGKQMNPMLVTISPTDHPELVVHGGQEFNYVLEGELRVIVDNKDYYLRAGDSLYFNPMYPHAQLAMGGPAKFLTIINE
ncbi:MAG: XRE family transcriptional regulator [Clostridia bacterium]|nr:XRE family transcriptional regulator [Clostridia bacterium]